MIKIYGGTGCSACETLKNKLDSENIQYTYIDIYEDMNELQVLTSKGLRSIPQVFDGDIHVGNTYEHLMGRLQEE